MRQGLLSVRVSDAGPYTGSIAGVRPASETLSDSGRSYDGGRTTLMTPNRPFAVHGPRASEAEKRAHGFD